MAQRAQFEASSSTAFPRRRRSRERDDEDFNRNLVNSQVHNQAQAPSPFLEAMANEVFAASNLAIADAQKRLDAQPAEIERLKKVAADVLVNFDARRDELQDKVKRTKVDAADPVVARGQQKQSYHPERNLPGVSLTGTWNANGGDWQEEVYQKITTMKDLYLLEIVEMYQKITAFLQQHDSIPHQPKTEQLEKLKLFKTVLERSITYLQVSKNNITSNYKEKLGAHEKQIISVVNTNRPKKPSLQQGQFQPSHMQSMQQWQQPLSQNTQLQPHENQVNPQLQAMNLLGPGATMQQNNLTNMQHRFMSSLPMVPNSQQASLDSTAETGNANGGDWQEEVYQKITTMKGLYLPEIMEMYQKIVAKLQQHDSLPHQPKTELLEKLPLFKTMLERIITYLQVSKNNITSNYKEKLGLYEKQIISFVNINRSRKPVPSIQQGQFVPVTSAFGAAVAAGTTSKCSTTTRGGASLSPG